MEILKILIFSAFFFQIIDNINCQKYVPKGIYLHTATLVGTKIYFLGGSTSVNFTESYINEFFYLDISESFDKSKEPLPFVNITDKASEIPPHFAATTSVFGELKDSIFFFGGYMSDLSDPFTYMYSFNTTNLECQIVTVTGGFVPSRRTFAEAVTDNDDNIYIFGGVFENLNYSSEMIIFNTSDKIWTWNTGPINENGRIGHTATFLPDTNEIVYIGGYSDNYVFLDITNVCNMHDI
jgi:hypothetical protein